jgi:hypothetical protein
MLVCPCYAGDEGGQIMLKRLWTYSTEVWETAVLLVIGIVILLAAEPRTWLGQLFAGILAALLIVLCIANLIQWIHEREHH